VVFGGLDLNALLQLVAALIAAGLFAGLIAGLFGVGGGVVIVPALYFALGVLGFPDERMHVAVATSLSTIILTSANSVRAHAAKGAVDFTVLKTWLPWIFGGAAVGSVVAGFTSGPWLSIIFGVLALAVAANMAFLKDGWVIAPDLPIGGARAAVASTIGGLSAMMGIGGGAFGVMVMTLCGRPIHQAVGTAAGFGAAIGIPAVIGFIITGWDVAGRPPLSLGYVNVPGFIAIGLLTSLVAPYGAKLAHRLDRILLKRLFAAFLALTALNILHEGILALTA